jgi:hypothetical protein
MLRTLLFVLFAYLTIQQVTFQVPSCARLHLHNTADNGQTDVGRINYLVYDQNGSSQGVV